MLTWHLALWAPNIWMFWEFYRPNIWILEHIFPFSIWERMNTVWGLSLRLPKKMTLDASGKAARQVRAAHISRTFLTIHHLKDFHVRYSRALERKFLSKRWGWNWEFSTRPLSAGLFYNYGPNLWHHWLPLFMSGKRSSCRSWLTQIHTAVSAVAQAPSVKY